MEWLVITPQIIWMWFLAVEFVDFHFGLVGRSWQFSFDSSQRLLHDVIILWWCAATLKDLYLTFQQRWESFAPKYVYFKWGFFIYLKLNVNIRYIFWLKNNGTLRFKKKNNNNDIYGNYFSAITIQRAYRLRSL